MWRLLSYFLLAGFIAGMLTAIVLAMFVDLKLAFIISTLIGTIFGLFSVGFTQRTLSSQTLEITSGNKHPERPMRWYEERIREQIKDMRFTYQGKNDEGVESYQPRALYRVFEPDIELIVSPYEITVTASRLMIRLISTYVEIEP